MRTPLLAMLLTSLFALGACSMPGASTDGARADAPAQERTAGEATGEPARAAERPADAAVKPGAAARVRATPAPPVSEPTPPVAAPAAGVVDRSCRTDADCAVKNVGSCCGAMPACVNVGANPDPAAVQAQCQREGMSSVCGFKEIQGCTCVAGSCQDAGSGVVDR